MSEDKPRAPKDIAILSGPTDDGQGAKVLRIREGGVSAGEIRPAREGEPIHQSELVRLHPLDPGQRVCAVEVLHAPKTDHEHERSSDTSSRGAQDNAERKAGPARVSNAKYRQNWSAIFEHQDKRDGDWSLN